MDRVPRCRLLTPFQEVTHHIIVSSRKNLNSASKVENWIIVDNLKYLYYVVTDKLLAYHFIRNGDW